MNIRAVIQRVRLIRVTDIESIIVMCEIDVIVSFIGRNRLNSDKSAVQDLIICHDFLVINGSRSRDVMGMSRVSIC